MVKYGLIGLAAALFISGLGLGVYIADSEDQLTFLTTRHYVTLILFLIAYIITWIGMTWLATPPDHNFEVKPKQWIAFGFTILMAIFWWGRYVFTIADTSLTGPK